MLFPSPIQVNNSLLPTIVFTSYWIKTVVFRMILICDVGFGLVYILVVHGFVRYYIGGIWFSADTGRSLQILFCFTNLVAGYPKMDPS